MATELDTTARNSDRLLLLVLWAISVGLALIGGTDAGFAPAELGRHSPWWPVIRTIEITAAESLLLYLVLHGLRSWTRSRRAFLAAGLAAALFVVSMVTEATDHPGWYYVNGYFAGLSALVLTGYALGLASTDPATGTKPGGRNAA